MENKKSDEEKMFDSFLNKTIILSSKKYYKGEIEKDFKEVKIMDDENYADYLQDYLKYGFNDVCNCKDITNFIDLCNNSTLVLALKSLSKIEMTVIFLLFEEQLTSSEASKILKICSDSVTRIKRRALKKLKNI